MQEEQSLSFVWYGFENRITVFNNENNDLNLLAAYYFFFYSTSMKIYWVHDTPLLVLLSVR